MLSLFKISRIAFRYLVQHMDTRSEVQKDVAREQASLIKEFVVAKQAELQGHQNDMWSSDGPSSISPFCPCASSRIPHIFEATRVTKSDVLWDLGCGDGRILHAAAADVGCRCVGVDIDRRCLADARLLAEARGVAHLCSWHMCDLTRLPAGSLASGRLGEDASAHFPAPTVVICYLTGQGLVAMSRYLRDEWSAPGAAFCIATCAEALDTAVDHREEVGGIFADENVDGWTVCRDHEAWGVFVVPPNGCSVGEWSITARSDVSGPLSDAMPIAGGSSDGDSVARA